MQKIIQLSDIYKTYDSGPQSVEVIKGISLTISNGEVVIIKGPSGVGKSTLLHILGALDLPTSGKISISGNDILSLSEEKLSRFRNSSIGFVFQFHHLLPEFTALENLLIPVMMYGEITEEKKNYARDLLIEVGLEQRMEHRPSELSGGEQQRVAVARALINKPNVLLADEPTGNLDSNNSKILYQLLLRLNKKFDQTLVIVTHDEHMLDNAHRIIELQDGRVGRDYTL